MEYRLGMSTQHDKVLQQGFIALTQYEINETNMVYVPMDYPSFAQVVDVCFIDIQ